MCHFGGFDASQLYSSLSFVKLTLISTMNGNKSVQLVITFNIIEVTITANTTGAPKTALKFRVASISAFQLMLAILATTIPVLSSLSNSFPFQLPVAFFVELDTRANSKLDHAELTPSRTARVFVLSAFLMLLIRVQAISVVLLFPFLC